MDWSEPQLVGNEGAWIGGLDDLTNAEFVTADGFVDDLESGSISVGDMSVSVRVADLQETLSQDDLNWAAEVIAGKFGHAVAGEMGWSQAFTDISTYLGDASINIDDLAIDLLADYNDADEGPGSVVMYLEPKFDINGNVLDQPPEFGVRVYGDSDSTEDDGGWNEAPTDGFDDYLAPLMPVDVTPSDPDFMPVSVEQIGDYSSIVLSIWNEEQAEVVASDQADARQPTIQILGYDVENIAEYDPQFLEAMKTANGRVSIDGPDGFGSVVRLSAEAINAVGRVKDDYRVVWLTYSDDQLEGGDNVVD